MSTLHTHPYSSAQPAAGSSAATDGVDPSAIGNPSASRDAVAAAAAAAAAVASNGSVLHADYSRGYGAMAPGGHGQMLPPPTQLHSQHQQQQQQQQQQQSHLQHAHQAHQHHHSLPSIDMNGHVAAAAAVAGYQSSYGLADGSSAAAGGMVGLIASPTGASWGPSPTSPLSSHSAVAALAAGQQHQSPSAWYNSVYQQSQYSPAGHNMVMYHDSYAQSPSAAAAAAAAYYPPRARLTTTLWEDEQTLVYQVDCRGICVARRHDDNMINGTKLLNVVGMSRGKRDGILKNEKGRRVVKVGPMHLKGVWIPFDRARFLAEQFKVIDALFPIFQPDPNSYLYGTIPMASPTSAAGLPTSDPYSAAAAGYSQLARAQDAYDPSGVVAAAAAAAAATGQSSPVSHSHTASLSQVMAAHHQQPTAHAHHHSMGQQQQQQQQQQGLGISYIGGAPSARMPGMPASPPGSAMAVSPAASYTEKTTRYTPYSTAFQTATGAKSSGPGSKRGSVDHHYSQVVHPSMPQQPHSAKAAQRPDGQGSAADQDGMSQQQQQSAMSSSYFEGLMAKSSEQ